MRSCPGRAGAATTLWGGCPKGHDFRLGMLRPNLVAGMFRGDTHGQLVHSGRYSGLDGGGDHEGDGVQDRRGQFEEPEEVVLEIAWLR